MASPASLPELVTGVPAAEPAAIRAALTPTLLAEFDHEWEIVLDRAKNSKELSGILELLNKWRHITVTEAREPGAYFRLQAKTEQIQRSRANRGRGFYRGYAGTNRATTGQLRSYRIIPDPETFEQVAALPVAALADYAEVLTVLELKPWAGHPQHAANPDGAVRYWLFGPDSAGQVVHLVLEQQREVHLLLVQWLGWPAAIVSLSWSQRNGHSGLSRSVV